jgi:hypothetical protein
MYSQDRESLTSPENSTQSKVSRIEEIVDEEAFCNRSQCISEIYIIEDSSQPNQSKEEIFPFDPRLLPGLLPCEDSDPEDEEKSHPDFEPIRATNRHDRGNIALAFKRESMRLKIQYPRASKLMKEDMNTIYRK